MTIFREGGSSCSGARERDNSTVCQRLEAQRFTLTPQQLLGEFPGASIDLRSQSNCDQVGARDSTCCATRCNESATRDELSRRGEAELPPEGGSEPGNFLQYFWVRECIDALFASNATLSWAVRVRPDLLYLNTAGGLRLATDEATFAQAKAVLPRHANTNVDALTASVSDPGAYTDWTLPGDWVMAVPNNANGHAFLEKLTGPSTDACDAGDYANACTSAPEYPILRDEVLSHDLAELQALDVAIARPAWEGEHFCHVPSGLTTAQQTQCEIDQQTVTTITAARAASVAKAWAKGARHAHASRGANQGDQGW